MPQDQGSGCQGIKCHGAGVLGATVPGCWVSLCQDAETLQCYISCATISLCAQGAVAIPGQTLIPSPCLYRLCLPHLLRP